MIEKTIRLKIRVGGAIRNEKITFRSRNALVRILNEKLAEAEITTRPGRHIALASEAMFMDSANDYEVVEIKGRSWFPLSSLPYKAMLKFLCGEFAKHYALYISK